MSSHKKGGGRHISKSERVEKMARKRDERIARQAYRKQQKMESYLADDENFNSFTAQMGKMGLQLRDIPGDGNCLFRALGDQMQGHGRNHHKFRMEVAKYMLEHRADFEPFVEDDVPFDRHVSNLRKPGTYAGNDAIVAFARLHSVNVVIHQLNSPMWTIKGTEKASATELHISYHNGDHYSSVRRIADNTETPANITTKQQEKGSEAVKSYQKPAGNNYSGAASYTPPYNGAVSSPYTASADFYMPGDDSDYDNVDPDEYPKSSNNPPAAAGVARAYRDTNDIIEQIMMETGCLDRILVQQTLEEFNYDIETSLLQLRILLEPTTGSAANSQDMVSVPSHHAETGIWSDGGSGTRIFGGPDTGAAHPAEMVNGHGSTSSAKVKPMSSKERKEQAKREKKLKAMERHRQRLRGQGTGSVVGEVDDDTMEVTHGMGVLQI